MPFYQLPPDTVGMIKNRSGGLVLLSPCREEDRLQELLAIEASFESLEFTDPRGKDKKALVEMLCRNNVTTHGRVLKKIGRCPGCGSYAVHPVCFFYPDAEISVTCMGCGHEARSRGINPTKALESLVEPWRRPFGNMAEAISAAIEPTLIAAVRKQQKSKVQAQEDAATILRAAKEPLKDYERPANSSLAEALAQAAAVASV